MEKSTTKFGEMFANIKTSDVKDQKLSNLIDSGAYSAVVKALYFTKGKDSNSRSFNAEVYIQSEDKTLYVKSVNFVGKDGKTPTSIGMSRLKTFLRAVDEDWSSEDKDFIAESEIEETTKLTCDNKPYAVNSFANAIDVEVAALVETVKEGENGTPYNSLKMIVSLEDEKSIENFKELVAKTPVRTIKVKDNGGSKGGMSTSGDSTKAKSAASKL